MEAVRGRELVNIDYMNQNGQVVGLPSDLIIAVQGIMERISCDHALTQERLNRTFDIVIENLDRTYNQLLEEVRGVPMAEKREIAQFYDELMGVIITRNYKAFQLFSAAKLEALNNEVTAVQSIFHLIVETQWEMFKQMTDAHQVMQQRDLEYEQARANIAQAEQRQRELAEQEKHAREMQKIEAAREFERQQVEAKQQNLNTVFAHYMVAHQQELAVAGAFLAQNNHVNKRLTAVPPQIDWDNGVVIPGRVECEGIGLPPAPAAPPSRPAPVHVHHHKGKKNCVVQ